MILFCSPPPFPHYSTGHFVFKQVKEPQEKQGGVGDLPLVTLRHAVMLIKASGSTVIPVGRPCHTGALMMHRKRRQQLPPPPHTQSSHLMLINVSVQGLDWMQVLVSEEWTHQVGPFGNWPQKGLA